MKLWKSIKQRQASILRSYINAVVTQKLMCLSTMPCHVGYWDIKFLGKDTYLPIAVVPVLDTNSIPLGLSISQALSNFLLYRCLVMSSNSQQLIATLLNKCISSFCHSKLLQPGLCFHHIIQLCHRPLM